MEFKVFEFWSSIFIQKTFRSSLIFTYGVVTTTGYRDFIVLRSTAKGCNTSTRF